MNEKLTVYYGRIVNVTGYRGDVAVYLIGRRKRRNGGGWAVLMADEHRNNGRWLRSPKREFRSLKSARRALERK